MKKGQLELANFREKESDRNSHLGGRSFYFFDFDDNILHLSTKIYVYHQETGEELGFTSQQWAESHSQIGRSGTPHENHKVDLCEKKGSYRHFRDHEVALHEQPFIQDIQTALDKPDVQWKGPSWDCFYHACFNQRPIALITARGHHPETIKRGVSILVEKGFLPQEPNYLTIIPVSHPETRIELGDDNFSLSVADLKKKAIRASVLKAFENYGKNSHHRFGMSDDDPKNIQMITEEMQSLKKEFPEVSFFTIDTQKGQFIKSEICLNSMQSQAGITVLSGINLNNELDLEQLDLFKK